MKVLITGANGFIGKNLQLHLAERKDVQVACFTRDQNLAQLQALLAEVDFVFHLAANADVRFTNWALAPARIRYGIQVIGWLATPSSSATASREPRGGGGRVVCVCGVWGGGVWGGWVSVSPCLLPSREAFLPPPQQPPPRPPPGRDGVARLERLPDAQRLSLCQRLREPVEHQ